MGGGAGHGLLQRAQYWSSPAGVAAASVADKDPTCHSPESPHQRAWLRTYMDLLDNERHWLMLVQTFAY